jgi:hypothetical protein
MTLAHAGAREVAYTILALERRDYEPEWLKERYCRAHRRQIEQHIQFADYWYTHNGIFTDLQDFTAELAKERGLELDSKEAWRWFGTGGFINSDTLTTGFGGYSLSATKHITASFSGESMHFEVVGKTHFRADTIGATKTWGAYLKDGRIERHRCLERNNKTVPNSGLAGWLLQTLKSESSATQLLEAAEDYFVALGLPPHFRTQFERDLYEMLEALMSDGWVIVDVRDGEKGLPTPNIDLSEVFHENQDVALMAK